MKLLRMNAGDGGTLGVWLFGNNKYVVKTTFKSKVIERKRFNKLTNAVNYYEKVLEEF